MDNSETYRPTGKHTTFGLLISLVAHHHGRINHLDIVMTFLNSEVNNDTQFMELIEGCPDEMQLSVI
jgi:hypothetical protein